MIKVEDYQGRYMRIFIDDELIYEDRPEPMAITNALAEYFEEEVDWELKDLPDAPPEVQEEVLSNPEDGEGNEKTGESVYVEFENEINDGSEDYSNDWDEEI